MKTLKFEPILCEQILAGTKTSTWRLFDDKDLQENDLLTLVNKDTLQAFGAATITKLYTKTLSTLEETAWDGHERFASEEDMYLTYRKYYGDKVTGDTEVKIISFAFTPLLTEMDGEKVDFVETTIVKHGVTCDVYGFTGNTTKDLGVVKVSKCNKTPLQKVLSGNKTLEIFKEGSGTLTVTSAEGAERVYHFPAEITEVQLNVGETMQWHAIGDLTIYEICYPPYQDGRFANIEE